jgi:predicted enzyme related to lactoylglutathione lyase
MIVNDVDSVLNKAGDPGANVIVPHTDIPDVGRFSTLRDPQ